MSGKTFDPAAPLCLFHPKWAHSENSVYVYTGIINIKIYSFPLLRKSTITLGPVLAEVRIPL